MERTIDIGGTGVRFRASARFLFIYRDEFNRDAVKDIFPVMQMALPIAQLSTLLDEESSMEEAAAVLAATADMLENFDSERIMDIIWAFAKNADETIPEPEEWYAQFEEFPFLDVMTDVLFYLIPSVLSTKGKKKVKPRPKKGK